MLQGKKALIVGVANKHSIAWSIAQAWMKNGAQIALSYENERVLPKIKQCIASVQGENAFPLLHKCNITDENDVKSLFQSIEDKFNGKLDMILHSVAFAPMDALKNPFYQTTSQSFLTALEVSAHSLVTLSREAKPLMSNDGGSIVALSYLGSTKVVPNYNVMGVAKAALEASTRHLAYELGPDNIRVNCLSPGPMNTLAARGIPGISKMLKSCQEIAPLKRNVSGEDVGAIASFLASDNASAITGQTIYADCGMHIMAPLEK